MELRSTWSASCAGKPTSFATQRVKPCVDEGVHRLPRHGADLLQGHDQPCQTWLGAKRRLELLQHQFCAGGALRIRGEF
ncbi:MAG: hypothetical protein IPK34_13215 [Ramlibacter sp.]|nr:hypothetical protein [Ramlibacter sp.]